MSAIVTDTHSLLWYLNNSPRLSAPALNAFETAERSGNLIHVPAITVVELRYLVEKFTLKEADYQSVLALLNDPTTAMTVAPLDLTTADSLAQVPRGMVPDMPDRIIAATALTLNLPLITCDSKIRALTVISTIW